jgi:hypothetical protein
LSQAPHRGDAVNEPFSDSLAAFALTALVIEITPGPNICYLAVL